MEYWEERCRCWLEKTEDKKLLRELRELSGDAAARYDAFCRELRFGTGGLRGIMGAGTNRMNGPVAARATQGLSEYLRAAGLPLRAVIGYDSRLHSRLFAETAAGVFAANGIRVFLFPHLIPTPCLSFAVRHYGCGAGVMITASHNPAAYNGYKVYGPDGCQITERAARAIEAAIGALDYFEDVRSVPVAEALQSGQVTAVDGRCLEAYNKAVDGTSLYEGGRRDMPLVYTPLNGAGVVCVPDALRRHGFTGVLMPEEQAMPDGLFPSCPSPNPENPEALERGLARARDAGAELLLATDPDCDRLGAAVKEGDGFRILSGNELGVLLLDFICRRRQEAGTLPEHPRIIKTIVTAPMAERAAERWGAEVFNTLTGFKYIGEMLGRWEKSGELDDFILGFEESCGYLSHTAVRDKDAVNAALLTAEMYVWYREQGLSLGEASDRLCREYGWYRERLLSFSFPGAEGFERMKALMDELRREPPERLGGLPVESCTDYGAEGTGLPLSDVLQLHLSGGGLCTVRPSGTEPKLKAYLAVRGESREEAERLLDGLEAALRRRIPGEG